MKKLFYIAVMALAFVSCSDKIYEEINTDPTRADSINPASQLTYAALQIYGDMSYVDVHREYTYAFTQHLMGCWNTTNYGGQHRMNDNEMSRPWTTLYPGAIRNLTDAIHKTKENPEQANLNAALRIFRVYVSGLLTDVYGDVPYTEAGMSNITGNTKPKYDKQEDIYRSFFTELKEATAQFSSKGGKIDSDPIFEGNTEAWKTFANSLRMRYAMRISDRLPDLAQSEFNDAKDGAMTSAAGNACVKHMAVAYSFLGDDTFNDFRGNALSKYFYGNDPANNPTYICQTFWKQLYDNNDPRTTRLCRFYIDDYMSVTSPEGRIDMTDAVIATQQAYADKTIIQPVAPGDFSWDTWPDYENSVPSGSAITDAVAEIQVSHPDYNPGLKPYWLRPKVATNFLQSNNPGVLMTYAEVCFLRAEAAIKGWTSDDAKAKYEEGIRESMDFLTQYYGCAAISTADYTAYLAQPAIDFAATTEDQKKQINTQAWILHFNNPAEAWANVRRSNYPELPIPAPIKNTIIDGDSIPVRLCYPVNEERFNGEEYNAAKNRVEGGYTWHARVWWDAK